MRRGEGRITPPLDGRSSPKPNTDGYWSGLLQLLKLRVRVLGYNAEAPCAEERGNVLTRPARLNEFQGEFYCSSTEQSLARQYSHPSVGRSLMNVSLLSCWPPPLFHSFFFALGPSILLNEIVTCRRGQLGLNNAMELHMVFSLDHSGTCEWVMLGIVPLRKLNRQFKYPGEIRTFPNAREDISNGYCKRAFPKGLKEEKAASRKPTAS